MASVTIPLETYDRIRENEEILKRLEGKVDFGLYEEVLLEMYEEEQEKEAEEFIENLREVLRRAYIYYPDGKYGFPIIDFDEEFVKQLVIKMLE